MLKKLTQQATDLILHSIASGEVMGANLLITKGNEELVYAQAGRADREAEKPIERNTIFRLYSMTKPITAVAAMILMERGMLDLYEPVADILPAFAHQKVERDGKLYTPERPILMHDLLAMTSGLVYPEEQTMGGRAVTKVFEETVVLLSHKKADSYIHIDVEFGEGEGKIPVDSIAKRAEAYKPKEKVTYKMIKEYIEAKYGFKVHTAYIAEVKRDLGLPMYDAPNAVEELKQPRKHPTPEKVEAIKDALRYFAVI